MFIFRTTRSANDETGFSAQPAHAMDAPYTGYTESQLDAMVRDYHAYTRDLERSARPVNPLDLWAE